MAKGMGESVETEKTKNRTVGERTSNLREDDAFPKQTGCSVLGIACQRETKYCGGKLEKKLNCFPQMEPIETTLTLEPCIWR